MFLINSSPSWPSIFTPGFQFKNLAEGHDYTLIPKNDKEVKNGLSTLDLILITRHILGINVLDSPYKMIAADINRSASISTLDLIQLRKVILNIDTEFANNTSWRFVDADYFFPDPNNPWKEYFPEIKNINNLKGAPVINFVAVKVGDVNYSAQFNEAQASDPRTTNGTLVISTEDQWLEQGREYEVYFSADLTDISGYQFALQADPGQLEIIEIIESISKKEHFGLFNEAGIVGTSFNIQNVNIGKNRLFGLRLKAQTDGLLSQLLKLEQNWLNAEAYDEETNFKSLALQFNSTIEAKNQLLQNFPNPFSNSTQIGFYLENGGAVDLEIQDVQGRVIKSITGDFNAGYHQLKITEADLPTSGMYFYRLITDHFEETKQLILK